MIKQEGNITSSFVTFTSHQILLGGKELKNNVTHRSSDKYGEQ
jgi:hypothetical protein